MKVSAMMLEVKCRAPPAQSLAHDWWASEVVEEEFEGAFIGAYEATYGQHVTSAQEALAEWYEDHQEQWAEALAYWAVHWEE